MNQNAKRLLHLIGALLSLILIAYLASRFIQLREAVAAQLHNDFPFSILALASLACLLAYLPISVGWALLTFPDKVARVFPTSAEIVLLSQAARYLPGNIGHLVGRVMLTRKHLGVSVVSGSALMTIELLLSLAAAALLSSAALPQLALLAPPWLSGPLEAPHAVWVGVAVTLIGLIVVFICAKRWLQITLPSLRTVALASLCYAAALVVGGLSLWMLLGAQHSRNVPVSLALLAYTTSWLAGFVTPGAPSGLGVREFILVRLLAGSVGEPAALLAAVLLRFCSVCADIAAFAIGLLMARYTTRPALAGHADPD
ncbi:lysylphosphatidylglycerol synthase domain-containing protein [Frateuria sp. GZRe14]|uniref:lysylphosphatidylglycerol synthase domain-containing protein n=1 Tax=Frateuria sp. GZRe14 TaxID=3351534 RepID=UPI003EDB8A20